MLFSFYITVIKYLTKVDKFILAHALADFLTVGQGLIEYHRERLW